MKATQSETISATSDLECWLIRGIGKIRTQNKKGIFYLAKLENKKQIGATNDLFKAKDLKKRQLKPLSDQSCLDFIVIQTAFINSFMIADLRLALF